jgi:hypothetical protein
MNIDDRSVDGACMDCKFYYDEHLPDIGCGECRFGPPTAMPHFGAGVYYMAAFPVTSEYGWCWRFERKSRG